MRTLVFVSLFIFLVSCKTRSPETQRQADRAMVQEELQSEMSLKADREHLAELRKDIPQDTKRANDELALFLSLMNQGTEKPSAVRERFQTLMLKTRSNFREKVQGLRERYRTSESQRRDEFLKNQKTKRDSFMKLKRDGKETREFFSQQERDRLSFFSEERSRRQNFESEIMATSKDFDSNMRERQKEFDEQYRIYSKKFSERPKEKNVVTGDEFKRLDETPATPLGTED